MLAFTAIAAANLLRQKDALAQLANNAPGLLPAMVGHPPSNHHNMLRAAMADVFPLLQSATSDDIYHAYATVYGLPASPQKQGEDGNDEAGFAYDDYDACEDNNFSEASPQTRHLHYAREHTTQRLVSSGWHVRLLSSAGACDTEGCLRPHRVLSFLTSTCDLLCGGCDKARFMHVRGERFFWQACGVKGVAASLSANEFISDSAPADGVLQREVHIIRLNTAMAAPTTTCPKCHSPRVRPFQVSIWVATSSVCVCLSGRRGWVGGGGRGSCAFSTRFLCVTCVARMCHVTFTSHYTCVTPVSHVVAYPVSTPHPTLPYHAVGAGWRRRCGPCI